MQFATSEAKFFFADDLRNEYAVRTDQPFSLIVTAVKGIGYIGLVVAAFMAPFRMRANPLRFAPLVAAWALVQAVLFARLKTRFGYFVAVCSLLFAIGIPNLMSPYLYVRYFQSA